MFRCKLRPPFLGRIVSCDRGVSAVEFSLIAPFLVLGTISTVDAGMAVYDKMMIAQVLRSGAHSAIGAGSEAEMLSILEATAEGNFTVAQTTPAVAGELAVSVSSYCVCPNDMSIRVECDTTCPASIDPTKFYELMADKEFDGVIIPNFNLTGSLNVIAQ